MKNDLVCSSHGKVTSVYTTIFGLKLKKQKQNKKQTRRIKVT